MPAQHLTPKAVVICLGKVRYCDCAMAAGQHVYLPGNGRP